MEWTRSDAVALASAGCMVCHGLGLHLARNGEFQPCRCVLRSIFRACYEQFRRCAVKEKYVTRLSLDFIPGRERCFSWGRKDEEFMADFVLVSRRTLDDFHYKIFNHHFLLGADWKLCGLRLKLDKGTFFHAVYRIEATLGRVFRELQPYALFPVDEYFNAPVRTARGERLRRPA